MNQLSSDTCADLMSKAEQELRAFFSAVKELFGSAQAELSAEDWLHELMAVNRFPASTREWRLLTVKASARLASRVNAQKGTIDEGTKQIIASVAHTGHLQPLYAGQAFLRRRSH
jgi:SRSO17 transposase